MKNVTGHIIRFLKDEKGITSAEVAIIAGFMVLCAATLATYLMPRIRDAGERVINEINN